jgi:hypothetical protein
MGKHKLHMVRSKSKSKEKKRIKRTKRTKQLTKKNKLGIIDVPISSKESLGSNASVGSIGYNYLGYANTFTFLDKIINKNKKLKNLVCIPNIGEGWMRSFLNISLTNESGKSIYTIQPLNVESIDDFIEAIDKCRSHRFIPINFGINVPGVGGHANMVLFDNKRKTIEHFEPHGNRGKKSELESVSRAYMKTSKNLKRFFIKYYPKYRYISPQEYESKYGLQVKLDLFSGLCVTWCILYVHYRILNPNISLKKLIKYMDSKIKKRFLSKYTRYIEDTVKGKI